MNTFMWLLKREYWEHRGGFQWAPAIAALVILLVVSAAAIKGLTVAHEHGAVINGVLINDITSAMTEQQRTQVGHAMDIALLAAVMPITIVLGIVSFFYLLGSLYDDRRDRSVLFWKSLPVSDLETVLSKVVTVTLVAPLFAMIAWLALVLSLMLLASVIAAIYGLNPFTIIWMNASPLTMAAKLLVVLPINALWALPTIGWLMLCSAFARRVPFLWAILVPVAVGTCVSVFDAVTKLHIPDGWFWQNVVSRLLFSIYPGSWIDDRRFNQLENVDEPGQILALLGFDNVTQTLGSANIWIGAAAGIAMIATALWLRRWRDET